MRVVAVAGQYAPAHRRPPGAARRQDPAASLADPTTPGLIVTGNTDPGDWATAYGHATQLTREATVRQVYGSAPRRTRT